MARINFNQTIFTSCQYSKSQCIIALEYDGSKAPIWPCLAQLLNLGCSRLFKNFLAYSTQCIFFIMRLIPRNMVMVAINMCKKNPSQGSGYMESCETMYYLLCFLFIHLFACLFNYIVYISISEMFDLCQLITDC